MRIETIFGDCAASWMKRMSPLAASKGKWKKKRQGEYWYWLGTVYKSTQAKKIKEDKTGVTYRVGVTGYTERTVTKD